MILISNDPISKKEHDKKNSLSAKNKFSNNQVFFFIAILGFFFFFFFFTYSETGSHNVAQSWPRTHYAVLDDPPASAS
jgi:hypothetical protein